MVSDAPVPRLEQLECTIVIWRVENARVDRVIAQRPCLVLAHEAQANVGELVRRPENVGEYVLRSWSIKIFAVTVGDACSAGRWRIVVQLANVREKVAGFGCDEVLVFPALAPRPFVVRESGAGSSRVRNQDPSLEPFGSLTNAAQPYKHSISVCE